MGAHRHRESFFLKGPVVRRFTPNRDGNVRQDTFASSIFRLRHLVIAPFLLGKPSKMPRLLLSKFRPGREKPSCGYRRSNPAVTPEGWCSRRESNPHGLAA